MNGVRKIMKKAKKSLLALTSLGMITGGYVHELNNLKVVHAAKNHDGVCQVETKTGDIQFKTSSTLLRNKLDLMVILDTSSSMVENFKNSISAAIDLVNSLSDTDVVTFAHYNANMVNTYNNGAENSFRGNMTKRLTKQQALAYLNAANMHTVRPAGVQYEDFMKDMEARAGDVYVDKTENANFQDIFMRGHTKGDTISVIQFTDGWGSSEDIDQDFAAWAKANAKTFMTVSYKNNSGANGGPTSYSIERMKAIGHPNIYDERVTPIDHAKIVAQFEDTGTERVSPTAAIKVTPDKGITLKEVKLVSPDGKEEVLPINANAVNINKELLKDGNWTLKVKADGLVPETRKVVATVNLGGKEVGKTELVFEGCKDDVKGVDEERTKVNIDFKTNYIEDKNLPFGTEKVITDGVIGIKEIIKTWNTVNGKRVGDPKVVEKMLQGVIDKVIARGVQKPKDFTYRVLDKDGKVLVDTTKVSQGYIGDKYKLEEVPKLEGYEVEKPEGVALDGTFKGENVNIDFVAYKLGKGVTLKTVTKDGKDLQAEQVLVEDNKRVGTEYTGKVSYEIKDKGRLYRLVALEQDSKPVDGKFEKDIDLKGNIAEVKSEYKAIYEEVKVGDVKVEFIDDTGKVLKSPVLLNTKDSLLGTDYKYDKEARLTVGSDTYALVKTTLEDKEVKEIKGQFDEKVKTYKLVYKKVVKPEPKKLPKTSSDNTGSLGLFSTIVGLGLLLLGYVRKLVLK